MTVLDYVLVGLLVLVLPAEALWWTLRRRPKAANRQFSSRVIRTMRTVIGLLALLFGLWSWEGRSYGALGLEMPLSLTGLIGLAASAAALGLLAAMILLGRKAPADAKLVDGGEMLPETSSEMVLFGLFALVVGCGWELLYRGYLLWALAPVVGTPAAVILAAMAYGLGHGSSGVRSLIGATISSFLFTIAYALTGSLWWLMLLHVGLPLVGALAMHQARRSNVNTP